MSHLDYDPIQKLLAAKVDPFEQQEVTQLKLMLPAARRYDSLHKRWIFPAEAAGWAVSYLIPRGYRPTPAFLAAFGHLLPDIAEAPPAEPGASVSALLAEVEGVLQGHFNVPRWVRGTLMGYNRTASRPYVSCQLAEIHDGEQIQTATVSVYLPSDSLRRIKKRLEAAGLALQERLPVLLRGRVHLNGRHTEVQLVVDDIDPSYTLGKHAQDLDHLYRRLVHEGIARRNADLPLPRLPLRVGVVSSRQGQGFRDLCATLERLAGPFEVLFLNTRMQGEGTAQAVAFSLKRLVTCNPDCILVIRGGGAEGDLNWFNDYALAREVCLCPVPVLIGIGHDSDETILDRVAYPFKTPTAVGEYLLAQVTSLHDACETGVRRATQRTQHRMALSNAQQQQAALRLAGAVRNLTTTHRSATDELYRRMRQAERRQLDRALHRQELARERLSYSSKRLLRASDRLVQVSHRLNLATTARLQQGRWTLREAGQRFVPLPSRHLALARRGMSEATFRLGLPSRPLQEARQHLIGTRLRLEPTTTRQIEGQSQSLDRLALRSQGLSRSILEGAKRDQDRIRLHAESRVHAALQKAHWRLSSCPARLMHLQGQILQRQPLADLSRRLARTCQTGLPDVRRDFERTVERLKRSVQSDITMREGLLRELGLRLKSVDPVHQLSRGFAMVTHPEGHRVRSARELKRGDPLDVHLPDGSARTIIQQLTTNGGPDAAAHA